jgi:enamine deaminase RidA (YjgF/YER057c/UK114 family)
MKLRQTQKQILHNLSAVLEAGGSSLQDVVKVNIFLADMGDFAAVNEVYQAAFGEPKPVSLLPSMLRFEMRWVRMRMLILWTRRGLVLLLRRCRWVRMWRLSVLRW